MRRAQQTFSHARFFAASYFCGAQGLDQSNFSRLRERLVYTDVARRFFNAVLAQARSEGLLSTEHFTVDGTLIEALASLKSLKRKDQDGGPLAGGDGSGMRDWKGERRCNATHESTTDPDAKLMRKGNGQPAKLSYGAHVLMDNRHGLCAVCGARCDSSRTPSRGSTARSGAQAALEHQDVRCRHGLVRGGVHSASVASAASRRTSRASSTGARRGWTGARRGMPATLPASANVNGSRRSLDG